MSTHHQKWLRRTLTFGIIGALACDLAAAASDEEALSDAPPGPSVVEPGPAPLPPNEEDAPRVLQPAPATAEPLPPMPRFDLTLPDYNAPDPNRDGYTWARAIAGVATANYLVWQFNWFVDEDWAYVTGNDWEANVNQGFKWDGNKLPTNFFSHPYHGAAYFSVGRASGLTFWESTSMAFLGSFSWELLGETEAPSSNDLIATTVGGIALGEMLYRLSSEVLDDSSSGFERVMREFFAALINPGRGIQRLVDGKAWTPGDPPAQRHVLHGALGIGVDRLRLLKDDSFETYEPRPLVSLQIEYGDHLPKGPDATIGPFEAFDFYMALNLGRVEEVGAQLYARGVLLGHSTDLGKEEDVYRDNNVFGLVQSFDFRGARVAQFGGMGVGPGDTLILRYGTNRSLRLSADVQWLVLGASSSPLDGERNSGYNFLSGITTGQELRLEMAAWGELGWRAKQYAGVVIDGEPGEEFIGHTRLWYEIDVVRNIGVGVSPHVVHRISRFDSVGQIWSAQLETQVYLRGHF